MTDQAVTHAHGQHDMHSHDDYSTHQQPIDDERIDGEDQAAEVDLPTFLEQLAGQAAGANPFEPSPAVAGTFAMYPHRHPDTNVPTGGIVIVMKVDEGPMKGTHRAPIPAGMIRMLMALAGGSGKVAALKAGFSRRKSVDG